VVARGGQPTKLTGGAQWWLAVDRQAAPFERADVTSIGPDNGYSRYQFLVTQFRHRAHLGYGLGITGQAAHPPVQTSTTRSFVDIVAKWLSQMRAVPSVDAVET
jgi:hypothetical protein